jgi:hypothetical protein
MLFAYGDWQTFDRDQPADSDANPFWSEFNYLMWSDDLRAWFFATLARKMSARERAQLRRFLDDQDRMGG